MRTDCLTFRDLCEIVERLRDDPRVTDNTPVELDVVLDLHGFTQLHETQNLTGFHVVSSDRAIRLEGS